jgi:hypothetical protein
LSGKADSPAVLSSVMRLTILFLEDIDARAMLPLSMRNTLQDILRDPVVREHHEDKELAGIVQVLSCDGLSLQSDCDMSLK